MRNVKLIFIREFAAYFATPLAYVFIVIFLMLAGLLTFFMGSFLERDQADLVPFFEFHPWLYLFLVPALSMRLWAEERKLGTIELFLTLPISMTQAVTGKFLAAWGFSVTALLLTFPFWITVNYLGNPDNGVVFASYIGSALMAGAYLAIGSMISACTKNQVIAFVVTTTICFVLTLTGSPVILDFFSAWASADIVQAVGNFGFLPHFQSIQRGVIDFRDIIFFGSIIIIALIANAIIIDWRKAT
jgi:ABC-2 type transport system permease protein|tara:strand:- start:90 stop:824 length:735 start_codon:yes stop_codon:yes gene_type:complete